MFHPFFRIPKKKSINSSCKDSYRNKTILTRRLCFENLESRELLSTYHWNGGYLNNIWDYYLNWAEHEVPGPNADLVFSGSNTETINNFTDGRTFNSITFESSGFSISDQSNTVKVSSSITVESAATETEIAADVQLNTLGTVTISVYSGADLMISGVISGAGDLKKSLAGALTLSGANSYSGNTYIGDSSIGGGYLDLDGVNRLPTTEITIWNSGILNLLNHSQEASAVHLYGGQIAYGTLKSQTDFDCRSGTFPSVNLRCAA